MPPDRDVEWAERVSVNRCPHGSVQIILRDDANEPFAAGSLSPDAAVEMATALLHAAAAVCSPTSPPQRTTLTH